MIEFKQLTKKLYNIKEYISENPFSMGSIILGSSSALAGYHYDNPILMGLTFIYFLMIPVAKNADKVYRNKYTI